MLNLLGILYRFYLEFNVRNSDLWKLTSENQHTFIGIQEQIESFSEDPKDLT
jgi:hypothetical protein